MKGVNRNPYRGKGPRMKKYFVSVRNQGILDGPCTFKQAMEKWSYWDDLGLAPQVLQLAIDEEGKEVK